FPISVLVLEARVVALIAVFAALLRAFAEARVQSRLSKLKRATIVAITILVPATASLVIVVAVGVSVAIVATEISPAIAVRVVPVFKSLTEVSSVEFTIAET